MKKVVFIILTVFLFSNWGCVKKEKAALKIGDIQITAKEFDKAFESSKFAGSTEAVREKFLNMFISRKLILKEAERLGLDEDPQFLRSIQLFWEQSLLKLILSRETKELSVAIKVDDREISNYYEKRKEQDYADKELSEVYAQIKLLIFRAKQSKAIQDWASSLRNKTKIEIDYKLLGIELDK